MTMVVYNVYCIDVRTKDNANEVMLVWLLKMYSDVTGQQKYN